MTRALIEKRASLRPGRPGGDTFADRVYEVTRHPLKAWLVLLVSLVITWVAWKISDNFVQDRLSDRFYFATDDIKTAISKRLQDQEEVLRGGVGLYAASSHVSRLEWRNYVESLSINEYYPGLQGFGFSPVISHAELPSHVETTRAEGFQEYTLRPEGPRATYVPAHFLEPFDWRNRRAFGYDMYSEPVRRTAMDRARDTGLPAITGKVTLVQETSENVQLGFLMYLPVYRNGAPVNTIEARRDALVGYVYSPFRVDDLMRGILGASDLHVHFSIHDGTEMTPANLLYNSHGVESVAPDHHAETPYSRTVAIYPGGRAWTIDFDADSGFVSLTEASQPILIASGGLLIDLFVFLVIGSLAKQHRRAESLAETMTAEWREQTARTQAIVDTVQDGIITIRDNGEIETFNSSAETIFGYPGTEAIGQNVALLLTAETTARLTPELAGTLKSGMAVNLAGTREAKGVRRNGVTFPLEITLSRLPFENEKIFTAVFRDLTERNRVDRMKNEFLSIVSHELRTPLTSLVASLGLVQSGVLGAMPEKAGKLVGIANSNAARLARLVNDILDAERIESGRLEMTPEPTEFIALMRKALEDLAAYAEKYSVHLRLQCEIDQAFVICDAGRLTQVIANLVSNAIKFSPQGEEVTITITAPDDSVRISITDRGVGIPTKMHDMIFERFVQVDASDRRSKDGSGLGLAIAKTIIEQHGSKIDLESQPGAGTTMSFALAMIAPPAGASQGRTPALAAADAA